MGKVLDQKLIVADNVSRPTEMRQERPREPPDEVVLGRKEMVSSDVRVRSPERKPAVKRRGGEDAEQTGKRSRIQDAGGGEDSDSSLQGSTHSDGRLWEQGRMRDDAAPTPDHSRLPLEVVDHLDEDDKNILCGAIMGVGLTEVYSPERIVKVCRWFQLAPGSSYDLTNGWNVCLASRRVKAIAEINEKRR